MTGGGRHNWRVANFVPVGTLLIARAEEYLAEAAGIFENSNVLWRHHLPHD